MSAWTLILSPEAEKDLEQFDKSKRNQIIKRCFA